MKNVDNALPADLRAVFESGALFSGYRVLGFAFGVLWEIAVTLDEKKNGGLEMTTDLIP